MIGGKEVSNQCLTTSRTPQTSKVPMKRLLSHVKTKMENYLAEKIHVKACEQSQHLVVAWRCTCKATHKEVSHLESNQEEADTMLLLQAFDATVSGATRICISSPDTDVFVLALSRYPELCEDTSFITGAGQTQKVIHLRPIVTTLGLRKTAALPAFHALSGANNTGSFAGKGKATCWKTFQDSSE